MSSQEFEKKGLSLRDVNEQYSYDPYRNRIYSNYKTLSTSLNQSDRKKSSNFTESLSNFNTILSENTNMSNSVATTNNEVKKNVHKTKKDFANKLRKNSMVFPPRNKSISQAPSVKKPASSSSSGSESESSYESSASSRSKTPEKKPPQQQKVVQPTPTKFMEPVLSPPSKSKLTPEEQVEKLKKNYEFQGFHPYYDKVSR